MFFNSWINSFNHKLLRLTDKADIRGVFILCVTTSRFKPSTTRLPDRDDTSGIFWFHFLAPLWIIQKPQIDENKLHHLSVCSYTQKTAERKKEKNSCLLQDKFIIPDPFKDCIVFCRRYQNNFFLKTFFLVFHLFFLMMTSVSFFSLDPKNHRSLFLTFLRWRL